MARIGSPSVVMYAKLKEYGISNRDAASTLLNTSLTFDGRTLKDRIDVREGRPQRYGTQLDANGRVCPLLDASLVNLWRQEVGLPPLQ